MGDALLLPTHGRTVINKRAGLTIRTHVAAADSAVVTSHILETDSSLYMVDCQSCSAVRQSLQLT